MKNIFMVLLITFAMVHAEDYKVISWSDLEGNIEAYDDPFKKLSKEQLYNLAIYARFAEMKKNVPEHVNDAIRQKAIKAEKTLIKENVDIKGLLAQREKIKNLRENAAYKANMELNNTNISISGYMLSLAADEKGETQEFLLVPIIIECFHEPIPPPNQIVYVKTKAQIEPFSHYDPMTIKGQILVERNRNELYLVDDGGIINSSYIINANRVEKYSK